MTTELIHESLRRGLRCVFHVNRKSLAEQTRKVFIANGLDPGMRASGYVPEMNKNVQISMIPTEAARSLRPNPSWNLHNADIVIVDEAHSEKSATAVELFKRYRQQNSNSCLVGLTATPLDVGHIYETLIVAGLNSELRECGAHLYCKEYSPTMPDVLSMRRKADGEYNEKDVEKKMRPAVVFGRILEHHKRLNPLLKPAIVFAPSVGASIELTEMYRQAGIRSAHICGKHIYYGEKDGSGVPIMYDSTKISLREKLFDEVRNGEIQAIVNRFVLTAGIDLPQVYHLVIATSFGSLTQYLQAGGRVLRNHDSLEHVVCQDHGANCLFHGSLNNDRIWDLNDGAKKVAERIIKDRQEGKEKEPIVCPKCGAMRLSGGSCFECGHHHSQSGLNILEEDGTLRLQQGPYIKQKAAGKPVAVREWLNIYFPTSKSKGSRAMTFNQLLSAYKHANPDIKVFSTIDNSGKSRLATVGRNGEFAILPMHPPLDNHYLWSQKVRDVPKRDLL